MRLPRHRSIARSRLSVLGLLLAQPLAAAAQRAPQRDSTASPPRPLFHFIGGDADDDLRTGELRGVPATGYLLRSPSSFPRRHADSASGPHFAAVLPRIRTTYNSVLPYSWNDEAMWAGRGNNLQIVGGAVARLGRIRLSVVPELAYSENRTYLLADPSISPAVPSSRNPYSSPWHAGSQSIDLPIRFGDGALTRLGPGQSSMVIEAGPVELGVASENEWWGPGIRNALLLSNNAPGFPHLFLRTSRPVTTPLGVVEGRWLAGGLTESAFFDFNPGNDLRSIALLGITIQPRGTRGLTVGAARSVFGTAGSWGDALSSFPRALADVGHPDAVPLADSASMGTRDALMSIFARLVLPASGVELYGELGRAEMPYSPRDLLEQPNHSQGYTIGMQWLGQELVLTNGRLRVQAEATYVEQSTTYRFRQIGSWYTSHAVPQGYTERGQPLGAAFGPGGSSQWLAIDHLAQRWQLGAYVTRVRWLEDAHSQHRNVDTYCSHDVSLLPGLRARASTRLGTMSADYSNGIRLNTYFRIDGGCFAGGRDERNQSLTLVFTPAR